MKVNRIDFFQANRPLLDQGQRTHRSWEGHAAVSHSTSRFYNNCVMWYEEGSNLLLQGQGRINHGAKRAMAPGPRREGASTGPAMCFLYACPGIYF